MTGTIKVFCPTLLGKKPHLLIYTLCKVTSTGFFEYIEQNSVIKLLRYHRKTISLMRRITTKYCLTVAATYTELRYHTHGLPQILTQITSVCSLSAR